LAMSATCGAKDLEDIVTFYNRVSAQALLTHLRLNCGGMEPEDLVKLQTAMNSYYDDCEGVPEYINKLEKARIKLDRGGLPMSDPQVLAIASASVYASQHLIRANDVFFTYSILIITSMTMYHALGIPTGGCKIRPPFSPSLSVFFVTPPG